MLQPDWDVTEEIHKRYGGDQCANAKFEWVIGHQDKDRSVNELLITAYYGHCVTKVTQSTVKNGKTCKPHLQKNTSSKLMTYFACVCNSIFSKNITHTESFFNVTVLQKMNRNSAQQ